MNRVAARFRIKKVRTTAFHPQSNGSLGRSHHALGEYVGKKFVWDEWVELAVFDYNASVHKGTKHTPYELVYGQIVRTPVCNPLMDNDRLRTYGDYMIKIVTLLHEI